MNQPQLFPTSVPLVPPDTREQAHNKVKPSKHSLRVALLKDLYAGKQIAADEWALSKGISILSARPRMTDLKPLVYRVGDGLTVSNNKQGRYAIRPQVKIRMQLLVIKFDLQRAATEILNGIGLDK